MAATCWQTARPLTRGKAPFSAEARKVCLLSSTCGGEPVCACKTVKGGVVYAHVLSWFVSHRAVRWGVCTPDSRLLRAAVETHAAGSALNHKCATTQCGKTCVVVAPLSTATLLGYRSFVSKEWPLPTLQSP